MKRTTRIIFSLILVLIFSCSAFGKLEDFGSFTVEVPEGWTGRRISENSVIITRDEGRGFFSVTSYPKDDRTLKEVVEQIIESFTFVDYQDITEPVLVEDSVYVFEMKDSKGVETVVAVGEDEKIFLSSVMTGIDDYPEDFELMLSSIEDK